MLYNKIKALDKFGHQIVLNFNKEGNYHKTLFGGLLSILVNLFVLIYIWTLINKVLFYQDDTILTVSKFDDPLKLGEIPMNTTSFVPTFIFADFYTEIAIKLADLEKYLNIEFTLIEKDWTITPPLIKNTILKHRKCRRSDFSAKHVELFKKFEFTNGVLCIDNIDKISLKGDSTSSW